MGLTEVWKELFIETAKELKGSGRRLFMARTAESLGPGGQRQAERELGWNRKTIRKGMRELNSGFRCLDAYCARGRKRAEVHLPNLLTDIETIVDSQSQTDPSFKTTRLYTRLSAAEVRRQLIEQHGYIDEELPNRQTINTKLRELDYYPKKVAKSRPKKKIPETDAIFEELKKVNQFADQSPDTLRLSMDAKARINIGPFSRGGKSRVSVAAADHDFNPEATLTPFGIFLPQFDELFTYFTTSRVTSDFIVDVLDQCWKNLRERFPQVKTLTINMDNGPENHSRRTQFVKRLVEFACKYQVDVQLAYYPPYHSKYNPVERCWGVLENHWNGALLDDIETVLNFTETMTWKGKHPVVAELVTETYQTGVKLTAKEMRTLETQLERLPGLEKWFVKISWAKVTVVLG